jgi:hypothetical protein
MTTFTAELPPASVRRWHRADTYILYAGLSGVSFITLSAMRRVGVTGLTVAPGTRDSPDGGTQFCVFRGGVAQCKDSC